jgi:hypothetical protein
MKSFLCCLALFAVSTRCVRAEEADDLAAVRAADEQRIAATLAGDKMKLEALLSEELHYGHADGRVQTKAQFIDAVVRNTARNLMWVPSDLELQSIAPGAVAMSGRAQIMVADHGRRATTSRRFLAVWRAEAGRWRLLAYQSTALAEGSSSPASKPLP